MVAAPKRPGSPAIITGFLFVVDHRNRLRYWCGTMSNRYQTIVDTPELRRAVMTLQEFDGYEIEKAKMELRRGVKLFMPPLPEDIQMGPGEFAEWLEKNVKFGDDILEMAEELERCE